MKTTIHIKLKDFCTHYDIDELFIITLHECQLIKVNVINKQLYIVQDDLPKLEKIIRLNQELGINIEGIEAIQHLLQKIEYLQQDLSMLKRKLNTFEEL